MLRFFFIFIVITYFFVRSSFAGEALIYGIHQQFVSTRAMGMGNAHVAVADDAYAMFFNPAGLPQLKESQTNLFIRAGADPKIKTFADEISAAGSDAQAISNVIEAHYGDHYSLRGPSIGGAYANRKWSIAFIPADVSVDAAVHRATGPAVNVQAYQDSTLAFGRAWNLRNMHTGRVDIGLTTKVIYRANLDKIVSIVNIQNDKLIAKEDANEGLTADFDVGAMWHLPEYAGGFWHYAQPTFGLVVHNVLDIGYFKNYGFFDKSKSGDPEKLHRMVDVGSTFKLPQWWVWKTKFSFDVRDMGHPNWTPRKGFHAGAEFLWEMASWFKGGWRAGINQGYWTAGFTGQIWAFKLDLSSYGQEVGTSSTQQEDRVYMFTTSLDF
jgi:hypothetical protein